MTSDSNFSSAFAVPTPPATPRRSRGMLRSLFDLSFDSLVSVSVIRVVYVMAMS